MPVDNVDARHRWSSYYLLLFYYVRIPEVWKRGYCNGTINNKSKNIGNI